MNSYQFFLKHAGYSYNPETETPMQGRIKGARALAKAERQARDAGYSFAWGIDDPRGSAQWTDEKPAWGSWYCVAHNSEGETKYALYGIDFGRDGEPWGNPYRRAVEAELALESLQGAQS